VKYVIIYFIGWVITALIVSIQQGAKYDTKDKAKQTELMKVVMMAMLVWWIALPVGTVMWVGVGIGKIFKKDKEVTK
jgi:hypothetical protein